MPATLPRVVVVACSPPSSPCRSLPAAQPTKPARPVSGVVQEPHPQIMAAIRALELPGCICSAPRMTSVATG